MAMSFIRVQGRGRRWRGSRLRTVPLPRENFELETHTRNYSNEGGRFQQDLAANSSKSLGKPLFNSRVFQGKALLFFLVCS
jgi:hypothetical protein